MSKERRRFPRTTETFEFQCRVFGDLVSSWQTVRGVNLSAGGLRFRSPEPLDPGTSLQMKIPLAGSTQPLEVRGMVVWGQMQTPGVTEHGVQFVDVTLVQQVQIDRLVHFLRDRR